MAHIKIVETKLTGLQLLVHLIDLEENFFLLFPQPIELLRVIHYLHYFRRRHHCRRCRRRLKNLFQNLSLLGKRKTVTTTIRQILLSHHCLYSRNFAYRGKEKTRLRISSNALLLSKRKYNYFFCFLGFCFPWR